MIASALSRGAGSGGGRLDPMTDYDRESMADAQEMVDTLGTVGRQPAVAREKSTPLAHNVI